jgi:ribosomal protein S8
MLYKSQYYWSTDIKNAITHTTEKITKHNSTSQLKITVLKVLRSTGFYMHAVQIKDFLKWILVKLKPHNHVALLQTFKYLSGKYANVKSTLEQVLNIISEKFSKCFYVRIILYLEKKKEHSCCFQIRLFIRVQVHVRKWLYFEVKYRTRLQHFTEIIT